MSANAVIHARTVNGIFRIGENNIDFEATSFKRFQVELAYSSGGDFELKYGLTRQEDGIERFPLQVTLQHELGKYRIPSEIDLDTVLMLGIIGSEQDSVMNCQIFRSANGIADKICLSRTLNAEPLAETDDNRSVCDSHSSVCDADDERNSISTNSQSNSDVIVFGTEF